MAYALPLIALAFAANGQDVDPSQRAAAVRLNREEAAAHQEIAARNREAAQAYRRALADHETAMAAWRADQATRQAAYEADKARAAAKARDDDRAYQARLAAWRAAVDACRRGDRMACRTTP